MAHQAVSQVQLFVSCKNLKKTDVGSKSDPYVVLLTGSGPGGNGTVTYREVARSETIMNSQNPDFTTPFELPFAFYEVQYVQFKVFDKDNVTADDFLGEASFRLAELMAAPGQRLKLDLQSQEGKKAHGNVIIRGEEMASVSEWLRLRMRGVKLANKDGLFGKSDPFYVLSRITESGEWQQVHKSETIMDNLSPAWAMAEISLQRFCNGDYARPIKVAIWDWDRNGGHDYMGGFETTTRDLLAHVGKDFQVRDETRKGKKGELAGTCVVDSAEVFRADTLLDYIRGGCQISLSVAIDFTGSNGDPSHPQSLHYIDPTGQRPNEYEQAIMSVGAILQDYDSDQRYPVFGFGGRIAGGAVSHCFPIVPVYNAGTTAASAQSEVFGVQGILDAYRACISSVGLAGPTLFGEVLDTAAAMAAEAAADRHQQRYQILLILTDGVINDMPETIERLVAASLLPLSVVIVGVGGADFSMMRELDADAAPLRTPAGQAAARDVVQFVPFSNCKASPALLAKETLAEVPAQLLAYMKSHKIAPRPPRPVMSPVAGEAAGIAAMSMEGAADADPPPPYAP